MTSLWRSCLTREARLRVASPATIAIGCQKA
jgi:hypothetical protein